MAGVKLSQKGLDHLQVVMAELEMELKERPKVLQLAFSKGLATSNLTIAEKREFSKFEFPISVVAKGDELLLIKHLLIEKLQRKINDDEVERYILLFVEQGLVTMREEINSLSDADNYLLYLLDKHNVS